MQFEHKIYAMRGEDGITLALLALLGPTNRYYVEFGTQSGRECNTRVLRELGYTGLLMDGGHSDPRINLHREFITAENVQSLFGKYNVPKEFDVLCIDIDFNDYHVWRAITEYSPRIVIIEYNSALGPTDALTVPYDPQGRWDGSNFFGASIAAMVKLGQEKGYTLVHADASGTDLFFVRNDLVELVKWPNVGNTAALFKPPIWGNGLGHPRDKRQRKFEEV